MNSRVTVVGSVALVLALLVVLNALSYTPAEQQADSEARPDRSTYNAGATGTRALYDYLQESGHKVVRWRHPPSALLANDNGGGDGGGNNVKPSTFVVVGRLRRAFEDEEAQSLLLWVRRGGRLVVIDRAPAHELLPASGGWGVASEVLEAPDDFESATPGVAPPQADEKLKALAPAQPTAYTREVEQVVRSRYASRLHVFPVGDAAKNEAGRISGEAGRARNEARDEGAGERSAGGEGETQGEETLSWPWATPTPAAGTGDDEPGEGDEGHTPPAPVVHVADGREGAGGALLVDYGYGRGRVVVLSDPFIVSNSGLARADNLILAANVLAGAGGLVAFDEYHQGRGATGNLTLGYFRGTPALAMLAQLSAIALAVLWTRSRRFARPLPAPRADRRSELEFVASMAELQQRARAYDLALENVYRRTRRALARYGGTGGDAPREEIAARVAARSGRDAREVSALMRECEGACAGEPLTARRALELVARLRRLERELGIRLRAREVRQRARGVVL